MGHLTALNAKRMKELKNALEKEFGFTGDLPYVFYVSNKERLYAVTRDITLLNLSSLRIDTLGMYVGTWEGSLRLSLEGAQLIGPAAKHHIIDLDGDELEEYLKGNPFDLKNAAPENGVYLVRHGVDFIGCCKISLGKLYNFMPKARRIKVLNR